MQHAIDIDDSQSNNQEQRLNALLIENRHLKQILAVHEQMHHEKSLPEVIIACDHLEEIATLLLSFFHLVDNGIIDEYNEFVIVMIHSICIFFHCVFLVLFLVHLSFFKPLDVQFLSDIEPPPYHNHVDIFTDDFSSHSLVDIITVIHLQLIRMIAMEKRLMYSNEQQQQVIIPETKNKFLCIFFPSCILIISFGQKMSLFYPLVRFYSRRLSFFLL